MLQEADNALLSALVLCSGVACIAAQSLGRSRAVYVFKPLTMLLILALALQPSPSTPAAYRWLVVTALLFSLVGDVLLMLPSDRFAAGLASFLVAHLVYTAAFAGEAGLGPSLAWLLPFAAAGLACDWRLWPGVPRPLRLPVLLYSTAIVLMGWQAAARWLAVGQPGALLACVGAILFMASDAALAFDRFRRPLRAAPLLVLGSYFAAQWLIALSVGVGEALVAGWIR